MSVFTVQYWHSSKKCLWHNPFYHFESVCLPSAALAGPVWPTAEYKRENARLKRQLAYLLAVASHHIHQAPLVGAFVSSRLKLLSHTWSTICVNTVLQRNHVDLNFRPWQTITSAVNRPGLFFSAVNGEHLYCKQQWHKEWLKRCSVQAFVLECVLVTAWRFVNSTLLFSVLFCVWWMCSKRSKVNPDFTGFSKRLTNKYPRAAAIPVIITEL